MIWHIYDRLLAFPHESIVKQEVISIIDHLQEQGGDECAAFYQSKIMIKCVFISKIILILLHLLCSCAHLYYNS